MKIDFSKLDYDDFVKGQKSEANQYPQNNYISGEKPFLRGPYSSMYTTKPWTIRQYAGFSTAEKSNEFYKKNLAKGQKGLSVAFDLPTHRGYDSDNHIVSGDVGMAGVAIDTIDDMKKLFDGIPLDQMSVSMTMNGAVIPIMAFYIVASIEQGVDIHKLTGTLQNDILKEFMVRNTFIYPPIHSMRIIKDIFSYLTKHCPKFNTISISGYHMQEAGASPDLELAYTLANGYEYIKTGLKAGLEIDDFALRFSFFWGIGMNYAEEIAKMRAGRLLWSEIISEFNPKNMNSSRLRTHCQTSGWSLTEQLPFNNIARTCIEANASICGGTQSLHTNSFDEAIALPTEFSAQIARNTQIYLQTEANMCSSIDPFGGSEEIERLTIEIYKKAKIHIEEINKYGGMTEAINAGIPKMRIEEASIKKQADIDNNKEIIIGVNKYNSNEDYDFDILDIDNNLVRENQIKNIHKNKENRDNSKVELALNDLTNACENGDNLLEKAIIAAQYRATLGEISMAMEKVFGRYDLNMTINTGNYKNNSMDNSKFLEAKNLANVFAEKYGQRPRILLSKMGQDGHDRGLKIVASAFSDIGFDVDISPMFQSPEDVAKQSLENDVNFVGISSLAAGHKTLVPKLFQQLKKLDPNNNIKIIVGGVIPKNDYNFLKNNGVDYIFGPGTNLSIASIEILKMYN